MATQPGKEWNQPLQPGRTQPDTNRSRRSDCRGGDDAGRAASQLGIPNRAKTVQSLYQFSRM
jgi:hypothetical protein